MTLWDVHTKNEAGQDDAVQVSAATEWEAEAVAYRESDAVAVIGAYPVGGEVVEPVQHTHAGADNFPAGGGNWWEAPQYDAHRGGPYADADAACAASCAEAAGVAGDTAGGLPGDTGAAGDTAGDADGDV